MFNVYRMYAARLILIAIQPTREDALRIVAIQPNPNRCFIEKRKQI